MAAVSHSSDWKVGGFDPQLQLLVEMSLGKILNLQFPPKATSVSVNDLADTQWGNLDWKRQKLLCIATDELAPSVSQCDQCL